MDKSSQTAITLGDMWQAVLRDRWILFAIVSAVMVLGLVWGELQTPEYISTSTLASSSKDETGSTFGPAEGLLGAASSLAGINITTGNETDRGIAVFTSRTLGGELIDRYQLAPLLFPDRWDWVAKAWKPASASSVFFEQTRHAVFGGAPPKLTQEPSKLEAIEKFLSRVSMVENKRTGIVTLSVTWDDPYQAARIAEALLETGNEHMRRARLGDATRRIEYLKKELSSTSVESVSAAIGKLIEIELATRMKANTKPDFMFEVIDKPFPPEHPYSPRIGLIALLSMALGVGLALLVVVIRLAWNPR